MRRLWHYVTGEIDHLGEDLELEVNDSLSEEEVQKLPDAVENQSESLPIVVPRHGDQSAFYTHPGYERFPSPPPPRFNPEHIRKVSQILIAFERACYETEESSLPQTPVLEAFKQIAEIMVWADQNGSAYLWETFMEFKIMERFVKCLVETRLLLIDESPMNNNPIEASSDMKETGRPTNNISHLQEERGSSDVKGTQERRSHSSTSPDSSEQVQGIQNVKHLPWKSFAAKQEAAVAIQSQILQSLSIIVQSVTRNESLYYLFTANRINSILEFEYHFESDEILAYFMSLVKTIAVKVDSSMLQFFIDPQKPSFPLYTSVTRFFDHRESMIRIAVRNITLSIFSVANAPCVDLALRLGNNYFEKLFSYTARLCGGIARAFELILDDGQEIQRTRQRTGLFRQKVRVSDVSIRLAELENILSYFADLYAVPCEVLRKELRILLSTRIFAPLFRPLASRASPRAMDVPRRRWMLRLAAPDPPKPSALYPFDAAARTLLLAFIMFTIGDSKLMEYIPTELQKPNVNFEGRTILNALKAMASDLGSTERLTFIALAAIEALVSSERLSEKALLDMHYTLDIMEVRHVKSYKTESREDGGNLELKEYKGDSTGDDEPMLMTLMDFEAPLTPSASLPTTPTYRKQNSQGAVGNDEKRGKELARMPELDSTQGHQVRTKSFTSEDNIDLDDIVQTFRIGEAPLREVLSSILLVVRRKEVRTLRVANVVGRIIAACGHHSNSWKLPIELLKLILDEIAAPLSRHLNSKGTTIFSIENSFSSYYREVALLEEKKSSVEDFSLIFTSDDLPTSASKKPPGAGRWRQSADDTTPPTEPEDAIVFFAVIRAYERVCRHASLNYASELSQQIFEALTSASESSSYVEKRDALNLFANCVLTHNPLMS